METVKKFEAEQYHWKRQNTMIKILKKIWVILIFEQISGPIRGKTE